MQQPIRNIMTVGPTEIEEEILELGSRKMVYNRTPEFSTFILEIHENLKYVFQTKNDVFTLTCSGTGAMETAVVNLLSRGDEVLVANTGNFGERWSEICRSYDVTVREIKGAFGEVIDPATIGSYIAQNTKAIFVTANETASCALSDVEAIGKIVAKTNAVLVVDAISSLCCDQFKADEWHCDVVLASANKGLALPPGLSFITFSDKAWKLVEGSNLPKYYFDIKSYKANLRRGQTPYTPAIGLLFQLDERLKGLREKGIDNVVNERERLSKMLRRGVAAMGLRFTSQSLSNAGTGIIAPEGISAETIVDMIGREYNIAVTPSPPPHENRVFRVGVLGDINEEDIVAFLSALKATLTKLGYGLAEGFAKEVPDK